jgi:hypothetical protein
VGVVKVAWVVLAAALAAGAPSAATAQWSGYAEADSADAADDALVGVDPGDVDDVAEALAAEGLDEPRAARARFSRVEWVTGYRSSVRLTAGVPLVAVGYYRAEESDARWVDVHTGTWVERVTVGGLRVGAGDGWVLGATQSRFGRSRAAPSRGLSVGPSLSVSRPKRGAAAALRRGAYRLSGAAWTSVGGDGGRWASLERRAGAGALALSSGVIIRAEGHTRAVSVSGERVVEGGRVSGEVAWVGRATFAVARSRAGPWSAEVYGGGAAASGSVVDVGAKERERGAALTREDEGPGWRSTASLCTVLRHGPDGERLRRRAEVRCVLEPGSAARLDVSARCDLEDETEAPTARLSEEVSKTSSRRGRVRVKFDVPAGPSLRLRYQTQAQLDRAAKPGFVSGAEIRYTASRGDVRVSVVNSATWSASSGYIARPGIAGYEVVSTPSRRGSDVAARAKLRLPHGATASLYAGVPWEADPRYLVSLSWRL